MTWIREHLHHIAIGFLLIGGVILWMAGDDLALVAFVGAFWWWAVLS